MADALLNPPADLDTAKKLLDIVKDEIEQREQRLIHDRLLDRDLYSEVKFGHDALSSAHARMEQTYRRSISSQ